MKTSKRLLSILLMLTMLLSMFTVMAFAEDRSFLHRIRTKSKMMLSRRPARLAGMKEHYCCNDCESYLEDDGVTVTTYEALEDS